MSLDTIRIHKSTGRKLWERKQEFITMLGRYPRQCHTLSVFQHIDFILTTIISVKWNSRMSGCGRSLISKKKRLLFQM